MQDNCGQSYSVQNPSLSFSNIAAHRKLLLIIFGNGMLKPR